MVVDAAQRVASATVTVAVYPRGYLPHVRLPVDAWLHGDPVHGFRGVGAWLHGGEIFVVVSDYEHYIHFSMYLQNYISIYIHIHTYL